MQIKTAFESSYFLGALVTAFSSSLTAKTEGVDLKFEFSISSDPNEAGRVEFVKNCLYDLGISHSFVSFPTQEGRRYVSGISKSKLYFLDRPDSTFLWLDSDTLFLGGIRKLKEKLNENGTIYVVPREGDIGNFNSGVFLVKNFQKNFEWNQFETSDFFSDQYTLQQAFEGKSEELDSTFNTLTPWGLKSPVSESENQDSNIIHFVGEVKPWHINPDYTKRCVESTCSFSSWFEMEQRLIGALSSKNRIEYIERRKTESFYRPKHTSKLSTFLISLQSKAGFGLPLVALIAFLMRSINYIFPRIRSYEFHPYH